MKKLVKRLTSAILAAAFVMTNMIAIMPATAEENTCDKTAAEIVLDMKAGWNLGNTLDAGSAGDGLSAETSWGNPKTTKAMIDAVRDAGFDTVRVPVSWGIHTSGSDHDIDDAWMARVKEVVDYCIDNDMYVILNTHHDISATSDAGYYPTYARLDASNDFLSSIWTQIANEFKDYDYHLIFETLNEPRLVDHEYEWWWPNDSAIAEPISCINTMNQTCLDAIRATGGNNSTRCIMVPGFCASVYGASADGFSVPNDSADDRIIVSVHAYTPVDFALTDGGTSTFSDSLKSEIDDIFDAINYIDAPVIIGEMSATNRNNSAERVKWAEYYFGKVAETIGFGANVPCVLWDNNEYENTTNSGEAHGHLNRTTLTWYDEPFIKAIMDTLGVSYDLSGPTNPDSNLSGADTIWSGSATASSWQPAKEFTPAAFGVNDMDENTLIAVKYTGDTPQMAMNANGGSFSWISPASVSNGVAYFAFEDILEIVGNNGVSSIENIFVYAGKSNSTTVTEVSYFSNTIEADTPYLQTTNVINGVYSARAVMLVSESDARSASKVTFSFNNGSKTVDVESVKCYSTVTACGDTLEAPDGYVYVAYAIKNIPSTVTLTCSGIVLE